jgi:tripartite-type tricarboxylate transporter receptor subunit TctC
MILPGADGSIGAGRAARARPHGYTIDVGFLGNHVLNGGFYSLQYYVLNDFARILPLVRASVVLFARKTLSANDLNELIDRLVEGQSQQGDGGSHRSRPAC